MVRNPRDVVDILSRVCEEIFEPPLCLYVPRSHELVGETGFCGG